MPEEPQLLPPELALGALREQLAPAEDLQHLRHIQEMLFECRRMKQSSMYTSAHRPNGPDAPGMPPRTAGEGPNPTVKASFMTRIRSDDDPCSLNGTTFHPNWPSCDWKVETRLPPI